MDNPALDDMTIIDEGRVIADLRSQVARLAAENQGLYERIESLEEITADQEEQLISWRESNEGDLAFWDEWGSYFSELADRHLEVEAKAAMLARSRGSGSGLLGRPADWTEGQAAEVRELRRAGATYRRIAEQAGLSLGQVQRILTPKARPPLARDARESRLAQVAIDTRRFVAAIEHKKKLAVRLAASKTNRRKP